MLKDLGIRGRILILTLLPSLVVAAVLGVYYTRLQLADYRQQLLIRGQRIAEQAAPLVAPALQSGEEKRLQRILNDLLNQPDVRNAMVLNPDRKLLVRAGPAMKTPSPPIDPLALTRVSGDDTTRILIPVLGRHLNLAEDLDGSDARLIGWLEFELSHKGISLRGYQSLLASLVAIGIVLFAVALISIRISLTIIRPLQQIKQAVAQLKDNRLETRLPPLGNQEMDELASGINRMAESLQASHDELQQSMDQTLEDLRQNVENMEIQNIELDMARKAALEASRIKSEFLANMSHEIRTPLNGILGFTQMLQKGELAPRQRDYLNTIETSANNLMGIINEVLDFSKMEAGKLILESIPFNLRDLIEDTLTILAPSAHNKQLELVCLIYRDTPLQLIGDATRLQQVLTNLVSNAIKFTSEGSIVVRAMLEDELDDKVQLRLSVRDTGIGLSPQEIRSLFQPFTQIDNSLSRQPGGTGLGLVISKRLIEQMGGEIGVDSEPNDGSDFWITLTLPKAHDDIDELPPALLRGRRAALFEAQPLSRQALRHQLEDLGIDVQEFETSDALKAHAALAQQQGAPLDFALLSPFCEGRPSEDLASLLLTLEGFACKGLLICPTLDQSAHDQLLEDFPSQLLTKPVCTRKLQRALIELSEPTVTPAPRQTAAPTRAPRILCVDDNPANLQLVDTLLTDMGAEVVALDNGSAAIEAVRHRQFDLVFMDMQMPGLDGRQTTERIRQWERDEQRSPVPVIALTAHAMANERRAVLQSGLDDYLTKPISERQLAQVVLKWTGLSLAPGVVLPEPARDTTLKVLDHEEGLRLAANKPELARDMLAMLLASLEADRIAIDSARQAGERQTLIDRVHRLHGATRYCGVPQLRAACQQSETLLKQGHPGADRALDDLDAAIVQLIEAAMAHDAAL